MHCMFILFPALFILAAIFWYTHTNSSAKPPSHSPTLPSQAAEIAPHTIEMLTAAVTSLQTLMAHPTLGGPGYLTIRIEQNSAVVTAEYPNIQEGLYRRIIHQELALPELLAEDFPEPLRKLSPEFTAESGGMVQISVQLTILDAYLSQSLISRNSRQTALHVLAEALRRRCSGLAIRTIGGELILTPVRETQEV